MFHDNQPFWRVHGNHFGLQRIVFLWYGLATGYDAGRRQAYEQDQSLHGLSSIVKTVSEFVVDLPRVVVVKPPERQTVVQEDAAIPHIQRSHGNTILLSEALPESKIECGVPRQIAPGILRVGVSVGETRAVIHVERCERLPGS